MGGISLAGIGMRTYLFFESVPDRFLDVRMSGSGKRSRDTPASLSAAAHASVENQPARSDAERAKREAGQMRSCTPTTSAPSATGRQSGKSQKSIACPKARPNRSRHWYADPRTRGGPLHRSAPGAFFSYTGRGAFSFWRNQKENGGRIAQLAPQLNPPGG